MSINRDVNAVETTVLTVGTSATVAASQPCISGSRRSGSRHTVEIYNKSEGPVYFGGSDVTVAKGIPIKAGESRIFPVNYHSAIYLVAEATAEVVVAEYSV